MENGQLVTKGENLGLQGGSGPKTRGEQCDKTDQYRAHCGSNHDLTNHLMLAFSDGTEFSVSTASQKGQPSRITDVRTGSWTTISAETAETPPC